MFFLQPCWAHPSVLHFTPAAPMMVISNATKHLSLVHACRKHAVAGCTAGLVSVLALHPLDVVKTRLQGTRANSIHVPDPPTYQVSHIFQCMIYPLQLAVQDGVAGALPIYHGTRDAIRRIVQDEGWRALYAGISPALLGAGANILS